MNNIGILYAATTAAITTETTTTASTGLEVSSVEFWREKLDLIVSWLTNFGIKLIIAIIIFIIGWKIISIFTKKMRKRLKKHIKSNEKKTAAKFGISVFNIGLKILLIILFMAIVGVSAATICAAVASCGIAIGLALQGSLSNLAGGIVIVFMKPFNIGDYIEAQGEGGTVEDINMFYTYLTTPDNRTVMIPNGVLANGVIRNNSLKDKRRVDFKFGISYDDDINLAREVLLELCQADHRIDKDPAPFIVVSEYSSSSIVITLRVWTDASNYWNVFFDFNGLVKAKFDENNIHIPYNQLDVNIKK